MESIYTKSYDVGRSSERMDKILNADDNNFCDKDSLPMRNDLKFVIKV